MDSNDGFSAIDDTNLPIIYHHLVQPHSPSQNLDNQPLTRENFGYNGPRSGHWTVKDTVLGSGIDDGVATVHYLRTPDVGEGIVGRHAGNVDWTLIGKLAKAGTREIREQNDAIGRDGFKNMVVEAERRSQAQAQVPTVEAPAVAEFYVPRLNSRGIRIQSKDGKKEVVRTPRVPSVHIQGRTAQQQLKSTRAKQELAEMNASPVKAGEPASQVSWHSEQDNRAIRITGKNGEEAFMELPFMPQLSRSNHSAAAPVHLSAKPSSRSVKDTHVQNGEAVKAARDAKAAQEAARMRNERGAQAAIKEQRASKAKMAAEAMMSGALPASSKSSTATKEASKASAQSSAKSFAAASGLVSNSSSKPPSVASSKTSVPPQSVGEPIARQSRDISWSTRSSARSSQRPHSTPSAALLSKEIGQAERHSPTPKSASITPFAENTRPSISTGPQQSRPPTAPAQSQPRSSHSSYHSQPNENGPTIFAGHGWISPHPLSVAPTEYEKPPDPVIKIPGGSKFSNAGASGGKRDTMTYDEWRELQRGAHNETGVEQLQQERIRRNFSRSSSSATRYQGGSWGFRNVPAGGVTEAVSEHDWASAASGLVGGKYESPRVESVRSDHGSEWSKRTFEHNFDGASNDTDEAEWEKRSRGSNEGKVRLRMPWDG